MIPTLLLLLTPTPALQQELERVLESHRLAIEVTGDGWSGPGADFLVDAARRSLVVAIGEQHGNRETPLVARQLLRAARPFGYRALAVEVGPLTERRVQALLEVETGLGELAGFLETYPFAVPFFSWREEAELWRDAIDQGYEVWGLDQEFVASARFHLDRLAELAPTDAALDLVGAGQERAWAAFERFQREGDGGGAFLNTVTEAELDALDAAFEGADDEARVILAELRGSAAIYQLWGAGRNYESNHRRIELMKRHLVERLPALGADGRLVLKLGNVHLGRGYSPLNQLDVGNLVAEHAVLRGGRSFHLAVVGLSRADEGGTVTDYRAEAPYLALLGSPDDAGWTVLDLAALRPLLHDASPAGVDPELERLVWRYDAALVVPRLHEAHELAR